MGPVAGIKTYVSHELGHNLQFYHTAGALCRNLAGDLLARDIQSCFLDDYLDPTSFMGVGGMASLPNFQMVQVRLWEGLNPT